MGFISKPIFARLVKRFQIRQDKTEFLENSHYVVPVTDADALVRETKYQTTTGTATNRTDTFTVPLGKRWHMLSFCASRTNAGVISIQIVVQGQAMEINATAATATAGYWNYYPMRLDAGDSAQIVFNSGTSGPLTSVIYYLEEDA